MKTAITHWFALLLFALTPLTLQAQVAGTVDTNFNVSTTGGNGVYCLALQPDGKILIGGQFFTVNSTSCSAIARLNSDGTLDSTFHLALATGGANLVERIAVQPDGKIVLTGVFAQVDGQPRNRIARLNADGTLQSAAEFNIGTGPDADIDGVTLQTDGKILVGGAFTHFNGQARTRLVRLNPDGSVESTDTFNTGAGFNQSVFCLSVLPDGRILAGGYFTAADGKTHTGIARLAANGAVDGTFVDALAIANVRTMILQPDGQVVVIRDTGVLNRLNSDGTQESTATFNPGITPALSVWGATLQSDRKIIVVGSFNTFNGQILHGIVRLNSDGSLEGTTTFNVGTGLNGNATVAGLTSVVQTNGQILVGGIFLRVNGATHVNLVRLANDAATQNLTVPDPTQVNWLRSGAGPEVDHVTFELRLDGQDIWTGLGVATRVNGGWQLTGVNLAGKHGSIRARGFVSTNSSTSAGLIEQIQAFNFDVTTDVPVLLSPATGSLFQHTVSVSYNLPEAALAGSVRLNFDNGSSTLALTAADSQEAVGTHSFTFDPADPLASGALASGPIIPEGIYSVTVSYQDSLGNPAASSTAALHVTIDATPPVLTLLGIDPAMIEAGSVYVDAGATAEDLVAGDLTSFIQVTSDVDAHTPGRYAVNYSVSDGFYTVSAARTVIVVDTTAPIIVHLPVPLTLTADTTNHAPMPDLTGQVTATDNVGVVSIVQDPAPGTVLGYGPHTVTFNVADAANNITTGSTTLTVADGPALTGRYAGLLSITQIGNGEPSGSGPRANGQIEGPGVVRAFMELKLSTGRFLTGFLRLPDARRVWFPGTILPATTHAETLTLNDGSSLALTFDGSGHVEATLSTGGLVLGGEGVLADAGAPAGVPGTYTAILEADGVTAPGWIYSVVSSHGAMRISGKLPDGSTINAGQGSIVDRHGDALIFVLGKGGAHPLLAGRVHFENLAASDFTGALAFRDGPCAVNGARFTPAPSGLPAGSYPLTLEGAGIDIASTVTLLPNNTATVLAPVTTFFPRSTPGKPATGIFYTTFTATAAAVRPVIRGSGIFHQKLGIGAGQFPHNGAVGRVALGVTP